MLICHYNYVFSWGKVVEWDKKQMYRLIIELSKSIYLLLLIFLLEIFSLHDHLLKLLPETAHAVSECKLKERGSIRDRGKDC
jgi:hypothetical protein